MKKTFNQSKKIITSVILFSAITCLPVSLSADDVDKLRSDYKQETVAIKQHEEKISLLKEKLFLMKHYKYSKIINEIKKDEQQPEEIITNKENNVPEIKHEDEKISHEAKAQELAAVSDTDGIYTIPLGLDLGLQKIVFDECQKYNLNYLDVMAIICTESSFRVDVVGGGANFGLFQINKVHHKNLSNTLNTKNDPLDPVTNIKWGTYLLNNIYADLKKQGYEGETLDRYAWSIYNRGSGGFKKHGEAVNYINKIYKHRNILKQTIEQKNKPAERVLTK